MKTTGKEFKAFTNDQAYWPDDGETYMDDVVLGVNGNEIDDWVDGDISDTCKVEIMAGHVVGCAKGPEGQSLAAYFKRWKKEQSTATIFVEADKARLDAVIEAVKAAGGRVAR